MNEFEKVDISETWLWENHPETFRRLLIDHSFPKDENGRRRNIIWATDSYESMGDGYSFSDQIKPELITGEYGLTIRPRALKDRDEQIKRVKDKAEVFTPAWVCNAQNNLVDEAWFDRKNIFNIEVTLEDGTHSWMPSEGNIRFPDAKGKTWKDYVSDLRLEITCGEAPYLCSRYDSSTGEYISLERRIGLLDRKLRVLNENIIVKTAKDKKRWIRYAKKAFQTTYGFEWQGDSLLIARETLLFTFIEFYHAKFGEYPAEETLDSIAYIISWNLWQMDGLKYVVPNSCHKEIVVSKDEQIGQGCLFSEAELGVAVPKMAECPGCKCGNHMLHNGQFAIIRDWKKFENHHVRKDGTCAKDESDIRFVDIIKNKN